ncbi:hypothetical protein MHU86_21458 [Fragilaria crotonensis]|nr:hypothetical protein MHU86_21458 [Fragilaria crotonensis]
MVNERTGVSRIEIPLHPDQDPKTCSEWQQIDVPTVVLEQLRSRNQKHFGQAAGTPFTVPPLSHQLGYRGDGEFADQILTGNYQYPAGLTDNVRKFLYHLRITDELAQLQVFPTIDEKDYVGKLKAWRESTVTSPSRMHLGHYKAMISKHLYSQIPEVESDEHKAFREELDFKQSEILRVHLLLMNYALERGYSYQRWQTVANSVLFKEPGNIRIHRTRIIHIYEADYNLMLGLKWRSALLQAEALAQLNSGQFGSRPKHNATDPVFVEELQLELSRITRKTLALTNYDATACYDRIIPNFAMTASRKFGVSATVSHSNARTLEQTDYRIRTDVGLATEGYQHSEDYPIYGTGQGSGNSPVIWCFISSILYDCYEELASTAQYRTPDNQRKMELGMIGYVDDSNGQTNCFDDIETTATALEVLHKMQKNANIWSQLLSVSGGALELTKCSYHIVHWKFATSGAPVLCNDREQFGGVAVSDVITGESYELQYLAPYEAHKTLDHYKEPSGIQTTQYRKLWEKSNALTSFLWSNHITREEAWIFYFSTYLPSVSYPLANSHFTESQLTKLQKRAMNILFAKCGFNRNTKREVLFGPLDLGGADFRRLYDQQGIGQIITYLRHWRTRTLVGDLLRMVLEWCNYVAVLSVSILENTSCKLPHLESKWIASLRDYLHSVGASIQVDADGIPPLEQENDDYVMERVVRSRQFKASEIRKINYCRLYLQAVMLSDLATVTGDVLDDTKLSGNPSLQSSRSRWNGVHQEKPSPLEWRLWRKANRLWSQPSGRLDVPLGRWLRKHRDRRIELFAYQYRNRLAVRVADGFVVRRQSQQSYTRYEETSRVIRYLNIPNEAVPTTVVHNDDLSWEVIRRGMVLCSNVAQSDMSTFSSFIESLAPWEIDILRHTTLSVDPRMAVWELQEHFQAGTDGSSKHHGTQGAFGWIVTTSSGERIASGNGPSRGAKIDSYRAECSGMLTFLRFLIRLAEYTDMFGTWVGRVGTDSQSMLDRLFGKQNTGSSEVHRYNASNLKELDVFVSEWDLLHEIQIALRLLPDVTLEYVKGHQDDHVDFSSLSLMAQLNVEADGLATRYQQQFGRTCPHVLMSEHAGAYLVVEDGSDS